MRHFSCDLCGKDMTQANAPRYTVKMEAFAATDPAELTEDDLDGDHVEEMARMLTELADGDEPPLPPAAKTMQYDLCPACYRKFVADPLGRESANNFDFSEN